METLSTFRNKVAKQFMADSAVRKLYGINQDNASFDNYFSKVSVEGILVYMWAFVAWVRRTVRAVQNRHQ